MQPDFQVESRSYDQLLRGSWRAYPLDATTRLSDEDVGEAASDCLRLWLPAGTTMHWLTRTSSLRYNCLQFFWPNRWYMLSAFYDGRTLIHTYANIILPPTIAIERLNFVDLDLSMLVKPNLSYEVLTMAEFEQVADTVHYNEETRIGALLALNTLLNSIRLAVGLFRIIPHTLHSTEFHLTRCGN